MQQTLNACGLRAGRYGHVAKLAEKEKEGVDSVEGAEGILFQVHLTVTAHAVRAHHLPASSARAAVEYHFLLQFRLPLCICACLQCAETLSEEVLGKMHAPPKNEAVPVIDTHKLPEADGACFFCEGYNERLHETKLFIL